MDFDAPATPPQPPSQPLPSPDPGAGRETSLEAYRTTQRGRDRQRIADYLRMLGARGATRDELSHDLGMVIGTVCGRCKELLDEELIYESCERRQTRTGKTAVVLVWGPPPWEESNDTAGNHQ